MAVAVDRRAAWSRGALPLVCLALAPLARGSDAFVQALLRPKRETGLRQIVGRSSKLLALAREPFADVPALPAPGD